MYRINAVLKSPLMVGGKTLNSNYRESRDYIPGSVLRAAYAKALVQRCSCSQTHYWLEYKSQSQCMECEFQTVCRRFSEIKFPALYPLGGIPYPATARRKKYRDKDELGIYDVLKSRLSDQGKAKGEADWERLEGIHKEGLPIKLIHSPITRTAIDYHRNAAQAGALYTQNAISEKYLDNSQELADVVFSGTMELSPEEAEALEHIKVLHIGADITRGFGVCHMSCREIPEDSTPKQIKTRIQKFQEGMDGTKSYVVLDLLTDAYLGLEDIWKDAKPQAGISDKQILDSQGQTISQADISDKQMLNFLEKKIGLSTEKYKLCKAYKFQEILSGFDTSKTTEQEMRRQSHLVVKAGAVFAYQVLTESNDIEELLQQERKGIGEQTQHGFGKVRICDSFHTQYDARKGDSHNG